MPFKNLCVFIDRLLDLAQFMEQKNRRICISEIKLFHPSVEKKTSSFALQDRSQSLFSVIVAFAACWGFFNAIFWNMM